MNYDDVFAAVCTDSDHCFAQLRTNGINKITGIQYELDVPDLYIDRQMCTDNIGHATVEPTFTTMSTFEFPKSIQISQTISVPYTVSW